LEFKLHVQQTVATKFGFLYLYVSNVTPNVTVYFDNLQVSHSRSPLLETNEYYPYGLKMASISYKASMTMTNRYGWNGGNEYEDEGELNYSNTFYRKYDAQIGRFTGIDMMAESFASLNPYQFGGNNPVMFNDPRGDQFGGANGERLGQMQAHLMNDTWGYNTSYGGSLESRVGRYGGEKATAAGKGYNDLFDTWDEIGFAKAEEGHYQFDKSGNLNFYGLEQVVIFGTFKGGEWKTRNVEYSGFDQTVPLSAKFLWDHYGTNTTASHSYGKPEDVNKYPDQCAIRLSMALRAAGVDVSQARQYSNVKKGRRPGDEAAPLSEKGNVLGSYNLAMLLKANYGKPLEFNPKTDLEVSGMRNIFELYNMNAIIFFQNFMEGNDPNLTRIPGATHIDLLYQGKLQTTSAEHVYTSRRMLIWFLDN
jgi:RHS repeat-associated protein